MFSLHRSLVTLLVITIAACSSQERRCDRVHTNEPAIFQIACAATTLETVTLSGACSLPTNFNAHGERAVFIYGDLAGTCSVDLTFSTGYVSSTHVVFTSKQERIECNNDSAYDHYYLVPATPLYTVGASSNTCVDAGEQ
jgi:hypothetical protein